MFEAGAAAERLGVSPSGLRRYATLYEQVHGDLPRKPKTQNRLYPAEALERLAAARQLVETERFKGILEALEALDKGVRPDLPGVEVQTVNRAELSGDMAQVLVSEVQAMRAELAELRAENREMRAENREMRDEVKRLAELPAPPADKVSGASTELLTSLAARLEGWLRRSLGR